MPLFFRRRGALNAAHAAVAVAPTPFGSPIVASPVLDAASAAIASAVLVGATNPLQLAMTFSDSSMGVYTAAYGNPTVNVTGDSIMSAWNPIRFPPKASGGGNNTDQYADHWLAIRDPYRTGPGYPYGVEFDFWQFRYAGGYVCSSVTIWPLTADGTPDLVPLAGDGIGAGLSITHGLITQAELLAYNIPHALVFATRQDRVSSAFKYPARKTDGTVTTGTRIQEGARVQLDPALNLDSATIYPNLNDGSNTARFQKMIGKCLQTYGAYCNDRTGATNPGMTSGVAGVDSTDTRDTSPTSGRPYGWSGDVLRAAGTPAGNPAGIYNGIVPYDYYECPDLPWRSGSTPNIRVLNAWDGT